MNYQVATNLVSGAFDIFFTSFSIVFTEILSLAIPAIGVLMLAALCGAWVANHRSSLGPVESGRKEEAPQ